MAGSITMGMKVLSLSCVCGNRFLLQIKKISEKNQTLFCQLKDQIIAGAAVVFCTVSTCGSFAMRESSFEIGIIDEAGQCLEVKGGGGGGIQNYSFFVSSLVLLTTAV